MSQVDLRAWASGNYCQDTVLAMAPTGVKKSVMNYFGGGGWPRPIGIGPWDGPLPDLRFTRKFTREFTWFFFFLRPNINVRVEIYVHACAGLLGRMPGG